MAIVTVVPKNKRVRNFRCHAKNEISGAFSEIVHTLIQEAKCGSVNHTKLLFDIGGVKEQLKQKPKHETGVSLAQMLWQELSPEHAAQNAETKPEQAADKVPGPVPLLDGPK